MRTKAELNLLERVKYMILLNYAPKEIKEQLLMAEGDNNDLGPIIEQVLYMLENPEEDNELEMEMFSL